MWAASLADRLVCWPAKSRHTPAESVESYRRQLVSNLRARSRYLLLAPPRDWDRIRRTAMRFARLWCAQTSDAEDIVQDALLALLQYRDDLHDPESYLFISVKQIALRRLARQRRPVRPEFRTTTTGVEEFETALMQRALHDCRTLSPRSRQVLAMTLEGYTQTEIASTLGVGRGVVAQWVARARRRLRSTPQKR